MTVPGLFIMMSTLLSPLTLGEFDQLFPQYLREQKLPPTNLEQHVLPEGLEFLALFSMLPFKDFICMIQLLFC